MKTLTDYLIEHASHQNIQLFFDIETFQYNEKNGIEKPSEFKNMTYSVAISWLVGSKVEYAIYPNFKAFFDEIINVYQHRKTTPTIFLNAHNTNKYDNHFLRYDLIHYYNMKVENYFLTTATSPESNKDSLKLKELSKTDKQGIILEKRVKSKINLEMIFFLHGIQFQTVDNWVKTNSSIEMLGNKMKRLGVVTDDELKTDFDYTKYNKQQDLTDTQARDYALQIFNQLSDDELRYIRNDVILLAKSVYYYSDIFDNFDYSKHTFTSNILDSYNTNNLTSMQLLNRVGTGKDRIELRYTDYQFQNENFYDYLKPFYRGGLNFYNHFHLGKIIDTGVFSMDIHSSYPYAMHNFKIPTLLTDYIEHDTHDYVSVEYDNDDYYSLYRLSKKEFDDTILSKIQSVILRQILVKYYSTNDFININTYTFKMIENITGLRFDEIKAYSKITFKCMYFGSRDQIENFYFIKTQGKYKNKLDYQDPYNIKITNELNQELFSQEEIDNSKVNLNGLYGIPALRPYFNLFRKDDTDNYYNVENGHKNAERNIVFSIFVTSVSLWNLLNPFKYLTQTEIDDYFLYCDTDSLYFKNEIKHNLPDDLFTEFSLGTWDMENENLKHFHVLNHKKYCYETQDGKIIVKSGGISQNAFDTDMSFKKFIETQFSDGREIIMNKGIYNSQGTISIYPSTVKLEIGQGYRIWSSGILYDLIKHNIMKDVRENIDEFSNDLLYIESVVGTFSISDMFPVTHTTEKKNSLLYLQIKQEKMTRYI